MQSPTARIDVGERPAPRLARALLGAGLVTLLLGLCAWRLGCVRAGPDPDSDAYGHYAIARQLLSTPLELRIHWVWLPLYHALLALPIALGATLDHVRQLNALAATLPPLFLLWALARERGDVAAAASAGCVTRAGLPLVALAAAGLTAAAPLLVQLGTTGQMEVAFSVLLTLNIALLQRGRSGAAAVALSALVLMRYEGWAVAATVGGVLLHRRWRGATLERGEWACALAPGACVLGWAALRRLGGEPWFGFLLDNQAFAEQALSAKSPNGLPLALTRYALVVPWRTFGLAALCAPLGLAPTLRRHGVWLVAPGLALIVFLTASSLTRSQLGLERHFTSVVPFAATWIAHGLARIAAWVSALARPALGRPLARGAAALALAPFLLGAALRASDGLAGWLVLTRSALREQREIARSLRDASPDARIICADVSVQVLSELGPERFERLPVDGQRAARLAQRSPGRDIYIVQRAAHLRGLSGAGAVVYGDPDGPAESLVVVHFAATAPRPPG